MADDTSSYANDDAGYEDSLQVSLMTVKISFPSHIQTCLLKDFRNFETTQINSPRSNVVGKPLPVLFESGSFYGVSVQ